MIDAADLFEIGKYIDSPLKQKLFPNKGDMGRKLLGAEVKLMLINSLTERRQRHLRKHPMFHHNLQIHRWIHSSRHPPAAGLTFPT